jgi:hypothetical protein
LNLGFQNEIPLALEQSGGVHPTGLERQLGVGSTQLDVDSNPPHFGCLHLTLLREVPKIPMALEERGAFLLSFNLGKFVTVLLNSKKSIGLIGRVVLIKPRFFALGARNDDRWRIRACVRNNGRDDNFEYVII